MLKIIVCNCIIYTNRMDRYSCKNC